MNHIQSPDMDLTDQHAVVTGGTRGIGAAVTRTLLGAGATVLATYRADDAAAHRLAEALPGAARGRLTTHRFDVADHDAVQRFFAEDVPAGGLQILVNNCGVRKDGVLGLMSRENWDRVMEVNLTGAFNMCKYAVRAMMTGRYGRIVNVTSPSGVMGFAGQANYAASKAGLAALTRSLAREVATRGITVNSLCPGFILTELISDLPEKKLAAFKRDIPMGRFGDPDEVAAALLFLVSRAASYVSGATLAVTGGIPV